MKHGYHFDTAIKFDREERRREKERKRRQAIEKAAPKLLEACKDLLAAYKGQLRQIYCNNSDTRFEQEIKSNEDIVQAEAAIAEAEKEG